MSHKGPHIAVNTRLLLGHRLEGIGRFAHEVLKRMVIRNPEVRFSFFFDRPFSPDHIFGENVTPYVIPPQARHPLLWHTWFHLTTRRKLEKLNPQVYFSPEFYLTSTKKIPQVQVIHDLAYEHFPKDIPPLASWHCRKYSPIYAHQAAHILTVSKYSKSDIIAQYGVPEEKISIVHNGSSEHFVPGTSEKAKEIRERFTGGNPYFHFVGAIQPRKNIETLLQAFDRFKSQTPSPVKLVLVGRKAWRYEGAMKAFESMAHKEDVIFTGYVSDNDLNNLYGGSLGLCYVPYFEGFGIPILEAMHSETAVICSDRTSMPEVAGEAAILVDPADPEAISRAMLTLWKDPAARNQLIEKGRAQRNRFSWDLTYEKTWQVLNRYVS